MRLPPSTSALTPRYECARPACTEVGGNIASWSLVPLPTRRRKDAQALTARRDGMRTLTTASREGSAGTSSSMTRTRSTSGSRTSARTRPCGPAGVQPRHQEPCSRASVPACERMIAKPRRRPGRRALIHLSGRTCTPCKQPVSATRETPSGSARSECGASSTPGNRSTPRKSSAPRRSARTNPPCAAGAAHGRRKQPSTWCQTTCRRLFGPSDCVSGIPLLGPERRW